MRNPGTCFIHRMKPNLEHLNILRRRIVRSDVAGWGSLVCLYSEQTRRQLWPRCKTGAGDALTPAGTAALSGAAVGAGKRAQTLSNRPALARSRAVLPRCEDRWHSQPVGSASVAPGARGGANLVCCGGIGACIQERLYNLIVPAQCRGHQRCESCLQTEAGETDSGKVSSPSSRTCLFTLLTSAAPWIRSRTMAALPRFAAM